jgi:peptidoglycan hydrolase-like protein with peptidoglycan-binding domain
MKLQEIIDNNVVINLGRLMADSELITEIQTRLATLGLLQAPDDIDGDWGPQTAGALNRFCDAVFLNNMRTGQFGKTFAEKLLRTNSLPNGNGEGGSGVFAKTINLDLALENSDSLFTIAIGHAEGNRTVDGGKNSSYFGHVDPGNGVINKGSFSVQNFGGTPQEADLFWLRKLRNFQPDYVSAASRAGLNPELAVLAVSVFDLFTQAPAAVTEKEGLLDRLSRIAQQGVSLRSIVRERANSFFDPVTGRLVTNFPNLSALTADQDRRVRALIEVVERA